MATVASSAPRRTLLTVSAWTWERRWSIRGCESFQGLALIEGESQDLVQIARAAQAWHAGTALVEIQHTAPFVHLTGRFEVPTDDPMQLVESEWQHLLSGAGEIDRPGYGALIEAASAQPILRKLYPFTSHWVLCFSTRTGPARPDALPIFLDAHSANRFSVKTHHAGELLTETTTAAEAVSEAVRHLPTALGPVTLGALE